jgi:hypothetical protein
MPDLYRPVPLPPAELSRYERVPAPVSRPSRVERAADLTAKIAGALILSACAACLVGLVIAILAVAP